MRKWLLLFVIYVCMIYVSYLHRESILAWIEQGEMSHLYMMFPISALISTVPIIPFFIFAGVMGAKYGLIWGALINWFGSIFAAMAFFIFARYSFAKYLRNYIKRFNKLDQFTKMIEKNTFIAVLFARVLHIIPPPVINIYSGISKMSITLYFTATAIGQIPGMLVYAFLGVHIFTSLPKLIIGISIYIVFLVIVLGIYRLWSNHYSRAL
jgi:uncharacterized membrane protein YdjX (TVP38/TMEM64 family)